MTVNQIYEMVNNKNLTPENILSITVDIMQLAQNNIKGKKQGELKKEIVLNVLKKITNENINDLEVRDKLDMMLDTCIPDAIDTMVQIARGEVDLGKTIKSCLLYCLR